MSDVKYETVAIDPHALRHLLRATSLLLLQEDEAELEEKSTRIVMHDLYRVLETRLGLTRSNPGLPSIPATKTPARVSKFVRVDKSGAAFSPHIEVKSKTAKRFWVVFKGKKHGIYDDVNDAMSVTMAVPSTLMKRFKSFNAAQFAYFEAANAPNGIEEIYERVPFLAGEVVGNSVIEVDESDEPVTTKGTGNHEEDVIPDSDERSMEF